MVDDLVFDALTAEAETWSKQSLSNFMTHIEIYQLPLHGYPVIRDPVSNQGIGWQGYGIHMIGTDRFRRRVIYNHQNGSVLITHLVNFRWTNVDSAPTTRSVLFADEVDVTGGPVESPGRTRRTKGLVG